MSGKARAEPATEKEPDVENVSSHLSTETYQRFQMRVVLEMADNGTKEDRAGLMSDDEFQLRLNKFSARFNDKG